VKTPVGGSCDEDEWKEEQLEGPEGDG